MTKVGCRMNRSRIQQQAFIEKQMDLYNNNVGRAIGAAHPYPDGDVITFKTYVLNAISNGDCVYLKPVDHVLSPSYNFDCLPTCLNGILPDTKRKPTNE